MTTANRTDPPTNEARNLELPLGAKGSGDSPVNSTERTNSPAGSDEPVIDPKAARRRTAYTVAYGVAVLFGIVPVFLTPQAWVVPVLAMLAYFLYGYDVARKGGFVFEF